MNKKQLLKIVLLNGGLVLLNIAAFSKGLLGLSVSRDNALSSALAVMILVISVLVFGYGNYRLLSSLFQRAPFLFDDLDTPGEFLEALSVYRQREVFREYTDKLKSQIERLDRKEEAFKTVLYQHYQEEAKDFQSLSALVTDAGGQLFENIKRMLSRMAVFDDKEYIRLCRETKRGDTYYEEMQLYKSHFLFFEQCVEENEQILIKLDNLLLEVSRMGEDGAGENNITALEETIRALKELHSPSKGGMEELENKYR